MRHEPTRSTTCAGPSGAAGGRRRSGICSTEGKLGPARAGTAQRGRNVRPGHSGAGRRRGQAAGGDGPLAAGALTGGHWVAGVDGRGDRGRPLHRPGPLRVRGGGPAQQRPARAGPLVGRDLQAVLWRGQLPRQQRRHRRPGRGPRRGRLRPGHAGPRHRPRPGAGADGPGLGGLGRLPPRHHRQRGRGPRGRRLHHGRLLHLRGRGPRGRTQGAAPAAEGPNG
jgi:hypothetical protein